MKKADNPFLARPHSAEPPGRAGIFLGQLYAQRHPDGYATLWQWHPGTWVEIITFHWSEFGQAQKPVESEKKL